MAFKVEGVVGKQTLSIESGAWAKQSNGAAIVRYGDTVVLCTVVAAPGREDLDFFPLTVDYREKTYAAGKFPGGFIKREGRPTTKEITTMRLTDRPLRPLFSDECRDEIQIQNIVLSADNVNDPDVLSMIGSSAALAVSDVPFMGPCGAVRVGRMNGELILMPTHAEIEQGDLDLVISGTKDAVMMVEASAKELSEADMLAAIAFGHDAVKTIVDMQNQLAAQCGKPKKDLGIDKAIDEIAAAIEPEIAGPMRETLLITKKQERETALNAFRKGTLERYLSQHPDDWSKTDLRLAFDKIEKKTVRQLVLEGKRLDGRGPTDIRPITCEVGILPRTHGSAMFTRGETQALVVLTLGTVDDEQRVDGLRDEYTKKFMLDYNFPPFCVGEIRPIRGPSRRDIGHGMLAERSLQPVIPPEDTFGYTIRIVSDILESNGSSSMATVCGGTLCLMDAGVPIKAPVTGIAMGLVKEGDRVCVLSDIMGAEDFCGDMDFKVAGTEAGITGLQMDIKITGVSTDIMRQALEQAREGRAHILAKMLETIPTPREKLSDHAPKLIKLPIAHDKIGLLIGPGGKTINKIQDDTGTKLEIDEGEEEAWVIISGQDAEGMARAEAIVRSMTVEPKVGDEFDGEVVSIKDFGCFVEIAPGKDGLVHISELSHDYIKSIDDAVKMGEKFRVKVIAIDDQGRIKLSRKALLPEPEGGGERPPREPSGAHGDRGDRGDRRGRSGGGRRDRRR
ncbi:MAG: polyribonucleotide nucleotidyltransferase [Planctomycetota bacterium]